MRQARQSGQDEAMGTACVARMFQAYGDSQKWWFDDGYEVMNMKSHEITGKGRKKQANKICCWRVLGGPFAIFWYILGKKVRVLEKHVTDVMVSISFNVKVLHFTHRLAPTINAICAKT